MSKLYDDVKKQGEQIDDLQKKVTGHDTRIETLETQAMATPPSVQPVNQKPITVKLPDDIATNKSISKMLDEKLPASSTDDTIKKMLELLPDSLAKGVAKILADNIDGKVKDSLYDGFRKEFAAERRDLYNVVSDLRYKAQSLITGQWWHATPHWVYAIFAILLLAAGGFGYGFFHQLNENSKLKNVEWLYRYERGLNRDLNVVMHRERQMLHGTTHEVDSLKSLIRHHEQRTNADTTFIYFYPSNL